MGVTHLGMQAMGAGANRQAPTANGEFVPRLAGRGGRDGRGGGGSHMLSSLLIVGVVGTAVAQVAQRTRRRRSLITA
jgi:hypothetical protein